MHDLRRPDLELAYDDHDRRQRRVDGHLDARVRQNIARIKTEPSIPVKDSVRGFVYNVKTGELREVV
jgi:carbonic anhydrase